MREALVCEPIRTPVGRFGGVLKDVSPADMAATVLRELVERSGIDVNAVDDVVFGQCYSNGEMPATGRVAALDAGLPVTLPGMQVDRRCGSGLQAVIDAAMQVQTGQAELIIAGGVESMSQVEHYALGLRWGTRAGSVLLTDRLERARVTAGGHRHPVAGGMLETAENLRREFGISRQQQDELALESHRRAVSAQADARFAEEIVPIVTVGRKGEIVIDRDEHPRPDTTLGTLSALKPLRRHVDEDATVTAGNSSGQNDGAAACIVVSSEHVERLNLRPLARLVSWGVAGVEPHRMGIGPVPASARALGRACLDLNDIDLIDLNEAFAAQVIAVTRAWGFAASDFDRLNVNGSGISLGHPVGATGVRILTTLLREMERREVRYGLETMCIGGGQGLAAIFERVAG